MYSLLETVKSWFRKTPLAPELYLNAPSWEFGTVWNQSLTSRPERPSRARDNIWASEIGGSMIDRYLRMNGVAQTNPPNDRSLRKFQAADIWEWIVGFVLQRAGLLIATQEKLHYQYPGLLRVTGKLDHLAGGKPNWKLARIELLKIGLPPIIETASLGIIKTLSEGYGDKPLRTIVLEVKSLGSQVFDRYETMQKADPRHVAQSFHYLKAKPLPEAHIVYVCRDDCRLVELPVLNPSPEAENYYRADIEEITRYIQTKERPAIEPEVLFDGVTFKFRHNWKVEYSGYLTLLYGYKRPIVYRDKWKSSTASWNRVFGRCVTGKNMTAKNLIAIHDAKKIFPSWDEYVDRAKEAAKKTPEIIKEDDEAEP